MGVIRSRAPLRISLGGGGTDVSPYPETNGGAVISTTIDRYAYVTIKTNQDSNLRVFSQDYDLLEIFRSVSDIQYNGKLDLIKAALKFLKVNETRMDIILSVDSPPGSGLGSSSALTVALIGALTKFKNENMTLYDIADSACKIEREEAGIKGGMQDQYAAAFGGFNFIEFRSNSVVVNPLRLRLEIQNELLASMILCDTGVTRLSAKILDRQIRSTTENQQTVMESLHYIKQLAYNMKDSLIKGNLKELGELLHSSWEYKKRLYREITNDYIDKLYSKAISAGAIGGKLLGAGAGGHILFLCQLENRQKIVKELKSGGCQIVKFNFDSNGLETWQVNDGRVLK